MNTLNRSWLFLILLGMAVTLLPACGTKTNVNSEKAPETVLNPEVTPVSSGNAEIGMPGENTSVHTYVEKIHRAKGAKSSTTITTTPLASTTAPTPVPTPNQTPAMETAAPVKKSSGSHWLLWVLVILVLGLIGWYFWNKSREGNYPTQPMPPTGGLSPVSGFTALKDRIEDTTESKSSIWTKKIF